MAEYKYLFVGGYQRGNIDKLGSQGNAKGNVQLIQ